MTGAPLQLTARDARRVLLEAQGLARPPAGRAGPAALERLIHSMGYVQLDSISVIERAHHLTLRSRMPGYRQSHLRTLLESRRSLFEHWTHDASAIPTSWRHHWKHRFDRYAVSDRTHPWWSKQMGDDPDAAIRHVLRRLGREGPLRSRDFAHAGTQGGWWNWKPAKAALEYLWRSGRIAVARREGFQKVYDLTSRVHPDTARKSSRRQHLDWACMEAVQRLAAATPSEIAGFFRAVSLADARAWTLEAVRRGRVIPVEVARAGGGRPVPCVALPDIESLVASARSAPLLNHRTLRLLCPFDPVIRDRKRLERLFGFDYRFEAFVPAAKRVYGYYVLPILQGDQLIGRADLKTDRDGDVLRVRGLWWEPSLGKPSAAVTRRLGAELNAMASFVGVSGGVSGGLSGGDA